PLMLFFRSLSFLISTPFFFFYCSRDPRDLHSFPTRRSSDLTAAVVARDVLIGLGALTFRLWFGPLRGRPTPISKLNTGAQLAYRSEEHTSELQSLRHLVCRLLLEKKKKKKKKKRRKYIQRKT